jgi:GDSL-like Lipase/Acylhydrolase family
MHPMARKILPLFFTSLVSIFIGCGGLASVTPHSAAVRSGTVFVGDSIFGRWDLNTYFPGKGYVNAGWFGQRTDQILAVFPSILDGSNVCHGYNPVPPLPPDPAFPFSCQSIQPPAKIVIMLGWNDLFQAKDPAQAAANIATMVKMAQAANVKVILMVPYRFDSAHPNDWMQPWDSCSDLFPYRDTLPVLNTGIRDRDAQNPMPTVDLEKLFTCQSDYTDDGIHPNASGYHQMHDAVAGII